MHLCGYQHHGCKQCSGLTANTVEPSAASIQGWRSCHGPVPDSKGHATRHIKSCAMQPVSDEASSLFSFLDEHEGAKYSIGHTEVRAKALAANPADTARKAVERGAGKGRPSTLLPAPATPSTSLPSIPQAVSAGNVATRVASVPPHAASAAIVPGSMPATPASNAPAVLDPAAQAAIVSCNRMLNMLQSFRPEGMEDPPARLLRLEGFSLKRCAAAANTAAQHPMHTLAQRTPQQLAFITSAFAAAGIASTSMLDVICAVITDSLTAVPNAASARSLSSKGLGTSQTHGLLTFRTAAVFATALARLRHVSPKALAALARFLAVALRSGRARPTSRVHAAWLAHALWAYASLGMYHSAFFKESAEALTARAGAPGTMGSSRGAGWLGMLDARLAAQALWAYACVGHEQRLLSVVLEARIATMAGQLDMPGLTRVIAMLADAADSTNHHNNRSPGPVNIDASYSDLQPVFSRLLRARSHCFPAPQLAGLVVGVCRLGWADIDLLTDLAKACTNKLKNFSPSQLAALLAGFASLGFRHPLLLQRVSLLAARPGGGQVQAMSGGDVAAMSGALAVMQLAGIHLLRALAHRTLQLSHALPTDEVSMQLSPQHAVSILLSHAALRHPHHSLLHAAHATLSTKSLAALELTQLLQLYTALAALAPASPSGRTQSAPVNALHAKRLAKQGLEQARGLAQRVEHRLVVVLQVPAAAMHAASPTAAILPALSHAPQEAGGSELQRNNVLAQQQLEPARGLSLPQLQASTLSVHAWAMLAWAALCASGGETHSHRHTKVMLDALLVQGETSGQAASRGRRPHTAPSPWSPTGVAGAAAAARSLPVPLFDPGPFALSALLAYLQALAAELHWHWQADPAADPAASRDLSADPSAYNGRMQNPQHGPGTDIILHASMVHDTISASGLPASARAQQLLLWLQSCAPAGMFEPLGSLPGSGTYHLHVLTACGVFAHTLAKSSGVASSARASSLLASAPASGHATRSAVPSARKNTHAEGHLLGRGWGQAAGLQPALCQLPEGLVPAAASVLHTARDVHHAGMAQSVARALRRVRGVRQVAACKCVSGGLLWVDVSCVFTPPRRRLAQASQTTTTVQQQQQQQQQLLGKQQSEAAAVDDMLSAGDTGIAKNDHHLGLGGFGPAGDRTTSGAGMHAGAAGLQGTATPAAQAVMRAGSVSAGAGKRSAAVRVAFECVVRSEEARHTGSIQKRRGRTMQPDVSSAHQGLSPQGLTRLKGGYGLRLATSREALKQGKHAAATAGVRGREDRSGPGASTHSAGYKERPQQYAPLPASSVLRVQLLRSAGYTVVVVHEKRWRGLEPTRRTAYLAKRVRAALREAQQ